MGPGFSTYTPGLPFPYCRGCASGVWGVPFLPGGATCQELQRLLQQRSCLIIGAMCQPVSEPRGSDGPGVLRPQRWEVRGRTGPKGPSPPKAERRQPAPHATTAPPPQPSPSAWSFSLGDPVPRDALAHPKQVPGPAWGSIRELGGREPSRLLPSNLSPTSQAGGYIILGSRTRNRLLAPSPKPALLATSPRDLLRWSGHEAPVWSEHPYLDQTAKLSSCSRPLGTPPWAGAGGSWLVSHQETPHPTAPRADAQRLMLATRHPRGSTHHTGSPRPGSILLSAHASPGPPRPAKN